MTCSDNIVVLLLLLQRLLLQIEVAVEIDKTNRIHTETRIARGAAELIITGTNIKTIVIATLNKKIPVTRGITTILEMIFLILN